MPVTGLLVRTVEPLGPERDALLLELTGIHGIELGESAPHAVCAVLEAPDYAGHDASLAQVRDLEGVSAVDIVFHDFSDVTQFGALPSRRRDTGR